MVSARTRKTDRFTKPGEYAAEGVPLFWRLETEADLVLHPYVLRGQSYAALPAVVASGPAPAPWAEIVVDLTVLVEE